MIVLLPRAALLTLVLCVAVVLGTRALSAHDGGLRAAFDADCGASDSPTLGNPPCFMGIRAGHTRLSDAMTLLAAHPWVTSVSDRIMMDYFGFEHLAFFWRDPALDADEPAWSGELVTSFGTVYMVRLEAPLALGDVWAALGLPEITRYNGTLSRRTPTVTLFNTFFEHSSTAVSSSLACPLTARSFLTGTVRLLELRNTFEAGDAITLRGADNPPALLRELRAAGEMC
ncbi:MAG: hypothetical protein KME04_10575 [Pleurocapsa minor GSE-CHR-MK-17-07R]|jgi:hypothetical protein|nr:hypothetical protein [Pleurocapsa minor GSE-CHR-MK 17-07R]